MREIAAGIAILASPRPAKGLWARIAGAALDLAALFAALRGSIHRGRVAGALGAVAGVTALDVYAAQRLSRSPMRALLPCRSRVFGGPHIGGRFFERIAAGTPL